MTIWEILIGWVVASVISGFIIARCIGGAERAK